jgi:hypothetical protein
MPKASKCFGSHATRIAINKSVAAENSGHVSSTVKHPQYECAVVVRLEDNQVISVCANSYRVAQVGTRHVLMRSVRNLLAVLPYLANERDSAPRIVERDVVADLLQVNFGLWCEVRAHSLRAFFCHFGVLAFQTVKYLGGGFRFAAAATPFDFATQTVDYRLTTLLIFFQKSQPIPNDLAGGSVTPALHLFLNEVLKVVTDCVA